MENKKEIGYLFKDKLSHLDKNPSDDLWNKIENNLDKKKKRRFLFWLIPTAIGALLIGSFIYFNPVNNKSNNSDKSNSVNQENAISTIKSTNNEKEASREIKTDSVEMTYSDSIKNKANQIKKPVAKKATTYETNSYITKKTRTEKLISTTKKTIKHNKNYEEYEVTKKYKIVVKKYRTSTKNKSTNKKVTVFKNKSENKNIETTSTKINNPIEDFLKKPVEINLVDTTNYKKRKSDFEKIILEKTDSIKPIEKPILPKKEKKLAKTTKDSTPISPIKLDYFISGFYGPSWFGNLKNNSILSKNLDSNKKSSVTSTNYGLFVKVKHKRFGLSLGVSKINLKSSTKTENNQIITDFSNVELNSNYSFPTINSLITNENAEIIQHISYYGSDVNFYYSITNPKNKFGIEALTGVSMLLLDENELLINSNPQKNQNFGKADNIGAANLSYNLGLGINYKLTDKLYLDANPILKYYISTFKNKNNAMPYSFSLQTGITYKF